MSWLMSNCCRGKKGNYAMENKINALMIEIAILAKSGVLAKIDSEKIEKSKHYTDEELFILWAYYMEHMQVSPYLSCFDLHRGEYACCIHRIFGLKSAESMLKYTKYDKSWDKTTSARHANDIVMTYKRKGFNFMRNVLKPKYDIDWCKKYLDDNNYGFLNDEGNKKFKEIMQR